MLLQNRRLVPHQTQGNQLCHSRWETEQEGPHPASLQGKNMSWRPLHGTIPSPISRHRKAAVGEASEAELEGQDSSFLTAFFSAFPVPGGCCREYLVVSTDLHMRVLANHPICGQQLEGEDKIISPGNLSFCSMPEIQNPAISTLAQGRQSEHVV